MSTVIPRAGKSYTPLINTAQLSSSLPLGSTFSAGITWFRIFAPRATRVEIVLLTDMETDSGITVPMFRDKSGVWSGSQIGRMSGQLYQYNMWLTGDNEPPVKSPVAVNDPYVREVDFVPSTGRLVGRIPVGEFDWLDDRNVPIDLANAVLYRIDPANLYWEDTTGRMHTGQLSEFISEGGLDYLTDLGITAIELPVVRNEAASRGHLFASDPELMSENDDHYLAGRDANRVTKKFILTAHAYGLGVIGAFDFPTATVESGGPLALIDPEYYFASSGDTSAAEIQFQYRMVQRLAEDVLSYWMDNYHLDGVHLAGAETISRETANGLLYSVRRINPRAALITSTNSDDRSTTVERFANLGWAAWNREFSDAFVGSAQNFESSYVFGGWQPGDSPAALERYLLGSPRWLGGEFHRPGQSVNYIDIGPGHPLYMALPALPPVNIEQDKALARYRLAALGLFTAQGAIALANEQELPSGALEQNQVIPEHIDGIKKYYQGLIHLRQTYRAFRQADTKQVQFFPGRSDLGVAFLLDKAITGDRFDFFVILNGNPDDADEFALPRGADWDAIATWNRAGTEPIVSGLNGVISIPPTAGMVLRR